LQGSPKGSGHQPLVAAAALKTGVFVRKRVKASFDPKTFLARVGEGKTISKYRNDQVVFSQGQVADAVFYIQQGKVKLTVVSEQGKEAVVAILGPGHFFGVEWSSASDRNDQCRR
jgi:CRP-like cAMP-binding protein